MACRSTGPAIGLGRIPALITGYGPTQLVALPSESVQASNGEHLLLVWRESCCLPPSKAVESRYSGSTAARRSTDSRRGLMGVGAPPLASRS